MASPQHSASGRNAAAHRSKDPERIRLARQELAEANIAAAIERALKKAPPLTPAAVRRLSALLRSAS